MPVLEPDTVKVAFSSRVMNDLIYRFQVRRVGKGASHATPSKSNYYVIK